MREYATGAEAFSIENENIAQIINGHQELVISYPVQFSNIPKILKDFINGHPHLWKNQKIFIIATMGMFSGDGAGILACLLKKYGASITGGLHLKMPDCISDEKMLKRSLKDNKELITQAELKIAEAVKNLKNGKPSQEGLGPFYHFSGLFGQRLYFYNKTKNYSDKLKIDAEKCVGCNLCVGLCPMKNIVLKNGTAVSSNQCTMCYRCVNKCPKRAITLLGTQVIEQCYIDKYL